MDTKQRAIGEWTVTWGVVDGYREGCDPEDVSCVVRNRFVLITAGRAYGDLYSPVIVTNITLEEAGVYVRGLPDDFDPRIAEDWYFVRNTYGSPAYQDCWAEE